jgi:hypothetical protein
MTTLTVSLSDEHSQKLHAAAERAGMSAEQLAAARLQEWLAQPDAQFQDAVRHVLEKNRELYKRLA